MQVLIVHWLSNKGIVRVLLHVNSHTVNYSQPFDVTSHVRQQTRNKASQLPKIGVYITTIHVVPGYNGGLIPIHILLTNDNGSRDNVVLDRLDCFQLACVAHSARDKLNTLKKYLEMG